MVGKAEKIFFFPKNTVFFSTDGDFAGEAEKQSVQSFQGLGIEGPGGKVCVCACVCVCMCVCVCVCVCV